MIKYLLNLIRFLIFRNVFKISLLLLALVAFYYADSFPNTKVKKEVISFGQSGSEFIYTVVNKSNSSNYDIIVFQDKQKLNDGFLVVENYNGFNILFWILFGISTLVFICLTIISLLNDDEDISWELDTCQRKAAQSLLYCELEDDVFYYMALGRLLEKSQTQIRPDRIKCDSLEYIFKCPKFSTKTQKRNNLLTSLGI